MLGIVLEIMISPHAFPSRQMRGQLLKVTLGKEIKFILNLSFFL